ncbi:MAG TPA: response regulator transcription factor [Paracoccus solventivorans]|uniref:Response regulator transcription factor n=1 Tax=Paracoccus solventivorans TaxID=53463 RepID=A0A832PQQ3_9RHOB|nr:response regulator transcription factor [Paracoccus solventivorans]HHW35202.1 response regulator transcription factor [Paracoccus solventivorans]
MTGTPLTPPARPLILCVEDEDQLRRDIADELAEAGYGVIEAASGAEAIERLGQARPDLVLCDISMPGLSGHDVLAALHDKGPAHADIPFVFLSALADPRQVADGKRRGADDYLVKPIDYDLLLATIAARLRQIDRIRAGRAGGALVPPPPDPGADFGLTRAELQVAALLAQGKTLLQIAADLGISRATVAFHLRHIFQKTDTNRQAELVAMLLRGNYAVGTSQSRVT